jgi:hypothetical protein
MKQASSSSNEVPAKTPIQFLLRFGILVREVHGLPDSDYAASKSSALKLFQHMERVHDEDEAIPWLRQDRAGTLSVLCAIIVESSKRGFPLSLRAIADSKRENTEWGLRGFEEPEVWWFFRTSIENMA